MIDNKERTYKEWYTLVDLRQHINIFYVNVYWKDSPLTKDNLSRPVSQAHKWDVSLK